MARRKDHTRDELKSLILDAAWSVIADDGIPTLTARRLGQMIGYAPGTIYNVFASMDEVLLHINGRTMDLLFNALSPFSLPTPSESRSELLTRMALAYVSFAEKHRPHWLALFATDLSVHKEIENWYSAKIEAVFTPLETLLASSGQGASLRMDARILWSSVHGLTYLTLTGKLPDDGESTLEDKIRRLVAIYVAATTSAA